MYNLIYKYQFVLFINYMKFAHFINNHVYYLTYGPPDTSFYINSHCFTELDALYRPKRLIHPHNSQHQTKPPKTHFIHLASHLHSNSINRPNIRQPRPRIGFRITELLCIPVTICYFPKHKHHHNALISIFANAF